MSMTLDFTSKTILITGSTRGIGQKIAEDLHHLGATVLCTGTRPEQVEALNQEAKASNKRMYYFSVDMADRNGVKALMNWLDGFAQIDGLVNNAGINRLNYVQEVIDEDWDDMVSVNLSVPFKLTRLVSQKMIVRQWGRIVNISSIFGTISKERRAVYSSTKFGIHGLTVGTSNDLARHGVLVNTVSPGFTLTDLTRQNLSEAEMANLSSQIPVRRLGETADISNAVVFLLSDLNNYITGQNIIVDGGFTNV